MLWGAALIILKYLAIGIGVCVIAVIIVVVGAAIVLSGRISREEEQTAEYRELVRRLYLARSRKNAGSAAANDHSAPLDVVVL